MSDATTEVWCNSIDERNKNIEFHHRPRTPQIIFTYLTILLISLRKFNITAKKSQTTSKKK